MAGQEERNGTVRGDSGQTSLEQASGWPTWPTSFNIGQVGPWPTKWPTSRPLLTNHGRVRSHKRQQTIALVVGGRGYVQCNLYKGGKVRCFLVHRLVARAFLGVIPPGYQVNHKDGVKDNNRVDNLEIVTVEENRQHARDMGLIKPKNGTANPRAKLTDDDVREIRRLRAEGVVARDVGDLFGVRERTVYMIQHRKAWAHVE